jgi:acyl carrier protein
VPLELQRQFFASLPQVALHNLYGPTEASVDVTFWECRTESTLACVPIGLPIANIQIYLLDQDCNPVPVGVVGELFIAGTGLARGYIGRADLTAERFIANPFGAPGARMYRSGDLARYLPDGSIEYLGRNDFQVKLRGFRMELGEIEAALMKHSDVRDAVVIVREDAPGEKRLVAYLVADDGAEDDTELSAVNLRGRLFDILPEYMIPAAYVMLATLPLTLNGKLDRKALPAPEEQSFAKRIYEAPVGETEASIAAVWQEFLGVAQVGRQDHFFELGGHSLLATQVIGRIQQIFEIDIPLIAMFQYPGLAAFSDHLIMLKLSEFSEEDIALLQEEIENFSEEEMNSHNGDAQPSDRPNLTI